MEVLFKRAFIKDIKKIKDKKILLTLDSYIDKIKSSNQLKDIPHLSKLKGYENFYRIRIGNYRLGFKIMEDFTIWLMRFLKREDIYKWFP